MIYNHQDKARELLPDIILSRQSMGYEIGRGGERGRIPLRWIRPERIGQRRSLALDRANVTRGSAAGLVPG